MNTENVNTGLEFNAADIAPSQSDIIPNGWYDCEIVSAEVKATKGPGNNERLSLGFRVIGEQFTGRQFFSGLNHKHTNATAQDIAQRDLSAICHATGVMVLSKQPGQGAEQFVGKHLCVKVGTGKVTTKYPDPQNEGKGYKAIAGAQPGAVSAAPAFAAAPAPTPPFAAPVAIPDIAPPAPAPVAPPVAPPAPPAPVAATFPPEGWTAHPASPGYYYKGNEVLSEADLKASLVPAVPAVPAVPEVPAAPTGDQPAWAQA